MKRLLFAMLMLPALVGAQDIFISQLPLTNAAPGSARIILEMSSLGTNSTWTIEASNLLSNPLLIGGTNSIRFTNECYVSYGLDTNSTLSVSNAGLAAVNGLYRTNLLNGYTQGIYKVAWATSFGGFVISNATAIVYGFDEFGAVNIGDGVEWGFDALGNPPKPKSWWGPITNCFTVLVSSSPLSQPMVSSNLYVNADIGNDTNALRGRIDRPWRNLQPALANQRPGDTFILGPGNFPDLPQYGVHFDVSNRVRVVGSGQNVTFIGTQGGADETIRCGSEFVVRGFTSYALLNVGALGIISTNGVAEDCTFDAGADAVYVADFETLLELRKCRLRTRYDGLADWTIRPGGSNRVIRLFDSDIYGNNPLAGIIQGITGGDSRIEMFGGSIEVYNGSTRNFCVTLDVDTFRTNKTGSVLLSGVRLRHASTNGLSGLATNFYNLPIFLDNCTEEVVTGPLTSGSFTNQWWHRNIALGNASARTNRLVDVTSLTNALAAASAEGFRVTISDDLRTASGTNIFIYPHGAQKINLNLGFTNITADGGSMTLMVRSNGWQIVNSFP